MNQQKIGKVNLKNSGGFVVNIQFSYLDGNGDKKLSEKSDNITLGFTKAADPGDLGVPNGTKVRLHVNVVLGPDQDGTEEFLYEKGAIVIPDYDISGTIFGPKLKLLGVPIWKNWSQNIVYNAPNNTYFQPSNQEELRTIILNAVAAGVTVRTSGQRHSQPALVTSDNRSSQTADENTWLVDLACYSDLGTNKDKRIVLDASGTKVKVNTGVREDELDAFLTANNKILQTVTAGGFFSLGGMTAVDVHGATIKAPIFAETISEFCIMGPDGNVISIDTNSPGTNGNNWKPIQFARVSLGALGIVTSVTVDVIDRPYATTLKPSKESFSLDNEADFISKFNALLTTHDRIETFLNPYSGEYFALIWDLDPNPPVKKPNLDNSIPSACTLAGDEDYGAPYEGTLEVPAELAAMAAQDSGVTIVAETLVKAAFHAIDGLFEDAVKAYSDLWLSKAARVMFMSYFIELPTLDENGLKQAWKGLDAVTKRLSSSTDFLLAAPLEFRFIKGGDTALAGTYTTTPNATFVNLDMIGFIRPTPGSEYPTNLLNFFADIEREWVALGGLPHNGKMYGFYDPSTAPGTSTPPFNPAYLKSLAGRRGANLTAFNEYRKQRDPNGLFSNAYIKSLLG